MSIKEMEALLEATRQKIVDQGRIADARLLEKERELEQAVIDAYLDKIRENEEQIEENEKEIATIKGGKNAIGLSRSLPHPVYYDAPTQDLADLDAEQNTRKGLQEIVDLAKDTKTALQDLLTEYKD